MPWWKRTLVLLIITLFKERGILQTRLAQLVDATFSYYKQCLFSISRSYLGNNFNIDRKNKYENKNKTIFPVSWIFTEILFLCLNQ